MSLLCILHPTLTSLLFLASIVAERLLDEARHTLDERRKLLSSDVAVRPGLSVQPSPFPPSLPHFLVACLYFLVHLFLGEGSLLLSIARACIQAFCHQ